jgi:hypothetical protein
MSEMEDYLNRLKFLNEKREDIFTKNYWDNLIYNDDDPERPRSYDEG